MNEQNLIPNSHRTPMERRENARKAGIASGVARRKQKQLREELIELLGFEDTQEKMCIALIKQAQRGNVRAFEIIRDTIGERPTDKIQITESISTIIAEVEEYVSSRK